MKKRGRNICLARLVIGMVCASLISDAVVLQGTRLSQTHKALMLRIEPNSSSAAANATATATNATATATNATAYSTNSTMAAPTIPTLHTNITIAANSSSTAPQSAPVSGFGSGLPANSSMPPHPDVFQKDCLAHLRQIIVDMDHSYTDVQILPRLEQECELGHEFPTVRDHGFEQKRACHEFAVQLMQARDMELQSGSQQGYQSFCIDYYEHKYLGTKKLSIKLPDAPHPHVVEPSGIRWKLIVVLVVAVLLIAVGFVVNKQAAHP